MICNELPQEGPYMLIMNRYECVLWEHHNDQAWGGTIRLHTCRESLFDIARHGEKQRSCRREQRERQKAVQQAERSKASSTAIRQIRKMPTLAIQTQDKNFHELLTELKYSDCKCIRIFSVDVASHYSLVELVQRNGSA